MWDNERCAPCITLTQPHWDMTQCKGQYRTRSYSVCGNCHMMGGQHMWHPTTAGYNQMHRKEWKNTNKQIIKRTSCQRRKLLHFGGRHHLWISLFVRNCLCVNLITNMKNAGKPLKGIKRRKRRCRVPSSRMSAFKNYNQLQTVCRLLCHDIIQILYSKLCTY